MAPRFIPARAGNTELAGHGAGAEAVHPRSRGEHPAPCPGSPLSPGSSPLARGTRSSAGGRRPPRRFIPARAGNTDPAPLPSGDAGVHPRSRGEHNPSIVGSFPLYGSSPLARGTRGSSTTGALDRRFIPARAGNTRGSSIRGALPAVHPRSRGEHAGVRRPVLRLSGSSPLARGTHRLPEGGREDPRFIPARAGNTRGGRRGRRRCPVHPRSRGEH